MKQAGAIAAYENAAMVRLHYRTADTIDDCLTKLGAVDRRPKVKVSRRASFEVNTRISNAVMKLGGAAGTSSTGPQRNNSMPSIIAAALDERLADGDSTSMSENSYF